MPLGQSVVFDRVTLKTGIDDMARAMSQAIAIGLQGRDMTLTRSLAGRIVAGCPSRDEECEVTAVYDFVRDGGCLRGETLTQGPRFSFEIDTPPDRGTYRIELPGGVLSVYAKGSGKLVRTVHPSRQVRFKLPSQPWAGLRYTSETVRLDTYSTLARSLESGIGDCDDGSIMVATLLKSLGFQTGLKVVSVDGKTWGHVYAVVALPKRKPMQWIALDTTDPRFDVSQDPADYLATPSGVCPLPSKVFMV